MKINKLDYVRVREFTLEELQQLEGLMVEQGYYREEVIDLDNIEIWACYGVDIYGNSTFYDTYFKREGGNDITDEFRDYLDNDRGVVVKEESSKDMPFTKDDLKDGMVVNFRDIDYKEGVVFRKGVFATDGSNCSRISSGGITQLEELLDNLKHGCYPEFDIMKVSYMDEVLWERVEDSPEQKRIKELEKIISEAQKELEELCED